MRAVVQTRYGGPDALRIEQVEHPIADEGDVVIKVRAATVNRTDLGFLLGTPWITRFFSGVFRPKHQVLGTELAGEVVGVGPGVTSFAVGDEVFGHSANRFGAHAEYLRMRADGPLAAKPGNATFGEAAAVTDGAILALTNLRRGKVGNGTRVLKIGRASCRERV